MLYYKNRYGDSSRIKDGLLKLIDDNITDGLSNIDGEDGKRTSQYFHKEHSDHPDLSVLLKYIDLYAPHAAHMLAGNTNQYRNVDYKEFHNMCGCNHMGGAYNFKPTDLDKGSNFRITQCWGNRFNEGQGEMKHNHFPYTMSFSYYVNLPEGSSPIIINDEPIDIEEGQVLLFSANQMHYVPNSDVDNRYAIIGNILYYYTE